MKYKKDPLWKVKTVKFIADFRSEHDRCPTIDEMRKALGLRSVSGMFWRLETLGFAGGRGTWRDNKKELNDTWICPHCQRPL